MSGDDDFLRRWSRRKAKARGGVQEPEPVATPPAELPAAPGDVAGAAPAPLPPVESLTPESDFSAFMKPEVDPGVKREALKVLLRDPRFNVMDGMDVYIDDYSKPDPIPAGWLERLNQVKHLGNYVEAAEEEKPAGEGADAPEPPPQDLPKVAEADISQYDTSDGPQLPLPVPESPDASQ